MFVKRTILAAVLAAFLLGGCKLVRTGRPAPIAPPAPAPPSPKPAVSVEEIERKVRAEIEEEARKEAERKATEEIENLRRQTLEVDIEVLGDLLDEAKAAVLEKDQGKVSASLGRLRAALSAVCASSPIGALEQAVLRSKRLLEKNDLEGARFHLSLAAKAAEGLKVGEISMADKVGEALSALEAGKAGDAKKALDDIEKALRAHPLFPLVERLFEHMDGAASAAGRSAWKVAEAEIEEASALIGDLEKFAKPAPEEKAEEEKPSEGKPKEGEKPAEGGKKEETPAPPGEAQGAAT